MAAKHNYTIFALFFLYLFIRLFFAMGSPGFNDSNSYFQLRQIENIETTGKPLIHDSLSYGGRTFVFMPLYLYTMAIFLKIFHSVIALKVINNIFASLVIITAYFLTFEITKNSRISIASACISSMLPIYLNETLNKLSPYSLIFPSSFLLVLLFIRLEKDKNTVNYLILVSLVMVLASSISAPVVIGLIFFVILSYLEDTKMQRISLEFVSFFSFFFIWASFIVYKNAFQRHGFSVIWENIPGEILNSYFTSINVPLAITSIGFLPLLFGIYGVYSYVVKKKNSKALILVSIFLASFSVLMLKLMPPEICLVYIGGALAVLFGVFLKDFTAFIDSTKFSEKKNLFFLVIVCLLVVSQIIPGIIAMASDSRNSMSEDYFDSFRWLNNNTKNDSVVLAAPEEGHLVTYFGKRKNVIDTSFLLIDRPNIIMSDVNSIYTQKFKIEGIRLLEKYDVDYVMLSDYAKSKYGIEDISYLSAPCFYTAYKGNVTIYKLNKNNCTLKSQ